MLDLAVAEPLEQERRREAVRIGRRALGPGLKRLFDGTLDDPAPGDWLELLRQAEERERKTDR